MAIDMNDYIPLKQAAKQIGVTTGRLRQMLAEKTLVGKKFETRDWWLLKSDVAEIKRNPPTVGRPRSGKKTA